MSTPAIGRQSSSERQSAAGGREKSGFGHLVAAEMKKAVTGTAWWGCLLVGVGLASMTQLGIGTGGEEFLQSATVAELTAYAVRYWFMILLGTAIFGMTLVTREYGNGQMARTILLSGNRGRVFWSKTVVSVIAGVAHGVVALALMIPTVFFIVPMSGHSAVWTPEATKTAIGVFACIVAAAPWGTALGWLLRRPVLGVGVLLALTLFVDEALFRAVPAVGRFTMQVAMGAVFRDGKQEALSVGWGATVVVAWILVASIAAWVTLRRRDVM